MHLSLLLFSPFLSFFSSLSFFLLFSLSFLPSILSLFLQIFGAATAAMPHRFQRAWYWHIMAQMSQMIHSGFSVYLNINEVLQVKLVEQLIITVL